MSKKFIGFQKTDNSFVQTAYLNGYHFGDRLLEGVPFGLTVEDDGTLSAFVPPQAKSYMTELNVRKWLGIAVAHAEQEDADTFYLSPNLKGETLILAEQD
jgi:hypothetical protein